MIKIIDSREIEVKARTIWLHIYSKAIYKIHHVFMFPYITSIACKAHIHPLCTSSLFIHLHLPCIPPDALADSLHTFSYIITSTVPPKISFMVAQYAFRSSPEKKTTAVQSCFPLHIFNQDANRMFSMHDEIFCSCKTSDAASTNISINLRNTHSSIFELKRVNDDKSKQYILNCD